MSADGLRAAAIERMQKYADDCCNHILGVNMNGSCEQIALRLAALKGAAEAYGHAINAVAEEYKKLMAPETVQTPKKKQEIY